MKSLRKSLICLLGISLKALSYGVGGIEILTNPTPSNFAQQSVISAEAVFYNPAGAAFLEDGSHMHYGAYIVGTDYETRVEGLTLDTTDPQVLPSFSYIYKDGKTAYYMGFGMIGQGGFLEYDISSPAVEDFDATIIHPGGIFGVSHQVTDRVALSLGGRYLYSRITAEGKTVFGNEFESRIDAWGIAPELGIHMKVDENWDIAAKYLGETSLNYDGSIKKGRDTVVEKLFGKYATDHRKNFPAVFSVGTGYRLNEYQKVAFGYNWIMESKKSANEDFYGNYDDTYEYSVSFEQYVNNRFDLILGYTYTDKGENDLDITDITQLDAHQIGTALRYKKSESTDITIGTGIIFYESEKSVVAGQDVKSSRRELLLGISVNTKL